MLPTKKMTKMTCPWCRMRRRGFGDTSVDDGSEGTTHDDDDDAEDDDDPVVSDEDDVELWADDF